MSESILVLASEAEAVAIMSMLEGMMGVLEDDGLSGSPEHEDMETALQWIGNLINEGSLVYPARVPLELSSSARESLDAAIMNVRDQGKYWDAGEGDGFSDEPFTAHIVNP